MRRKLTGFLLLFVGALATPHSVLAAVYDANTTVGSIGGFFDTTPAYMQQITLAGANGPYKIDQFTIFGVRSITGVTPAVMLLQFWTGVDLAAGAADALATATMTDAVGFNLPALAANSSFNFNLGPGLDIDVPSSTFAVEVLYLTPDLSAYSPAFGGRFSTGTPSIGSSTGFVWFDDNLDGVYSGGEQADFGAPTNIRMVIEARLVPEPSSLVLGGIGLAGLALAGWRRRAR